MFAKKVIVAIDFTNEIQNLFTDMKQMEFLNNSEIHFVHVANIVSYSFVFSNTPLIYPIEEDRNLIEQSSLENLSKLSQGVLPNNFAGKVLHHCLFSENPKQCFVDFANKEKADLLIIATRQRRGLFESSFASYIEKNTTANILLIKHHDARS